MESSHASPFVIRNLLGTGLIATILT